jgi:hypothetical protein
MTAPAAEHPFSFESSFDPNDPRDRAVKRPLRLGFAKNISSVFGLWADCCCSGRHHRVGCDNAAMTTFFWAIRERSREREAIERLA